MLLPLCIDATCRTECLRISLNQSLPTSQTLALQHRASFSPPITARDADTAVSVHTPVVLPADAKPGMHSTEQIAPRVPHRWGRRRRPPRRRVGCIPWLAAKETSTRRKVVQGMDRKVAQKVTGHAYRSVLKSVHTGRARTMSRKLTNVAENAVAGDAALSNGITRKTASGHEPSLTVEKKGAHRAPPVWTRVCADRKGRVNNGCVPGCAWQFARSPFRLPADAAFQDDRMRGQRGHRGYWAHNYRPGKRAASVGCPVCELSSAYNHRRTQSHSATYSLPFCHAAHPIKCHSFGGPVNLR